MKNKRYDKTKIKQRSSTAKPATTGPWPYIPVNVLEHEFLFLETNEAFTVLHNTANASNSKGYLLSSRLPAEWKVATEVKGKKKNKIRHGRLGGHYLPVPCTLLACLVSCYSRYPTCARSACMFKQKS